MAAKRLRDLIRIFGLLQKLQEQFLEVAEAKMDAMRRADTAAMQALSRREQEVIKRLQERDGLRLQLMDAIGRESGLSSQEARALTVSQMAARMPKDAASELLDAARRLREVVFRVARANRLVGSVSRAILHHLQWVFEQVRPSGETPAGYSGRGELVKSWDTRILETVG